MHHDNRADHTGAHSPTGGPAEFLLPFAILKLNAAGAREILTEKMGSTGLDRLPVLHHCLN
jgi:hypothetical protein